MGRPKITMPREMLLVMLSVSLVCCTGMNVDPAQMVGLLADVDASALMMQTQLKNCDGEEACEMGVIKSATDYESSKLNPGKLDDCLSTRASLQEQADAQKSEVADVQKVLAEMKASLKALNPKKKEDAEVQTEAAAQAKTVIPDKPETDEPEADKKFMTVARCEREVAALQIQVVRNRSTKKSASLAIQEMKNNALAKVDDKL